MHSTPKRPLGRLETWLSGAVPDFVGVGVSIFSFKLTEIKLMISKHPFRCPLHPSPVCCRVGIVVGGNSAEEG